MILSGRAASAVLLLFLVSSCAAIHLPSIFSKGRNQEPLAAASEDTTPSPEEPKPVHFDKDKAVMKSILSLDGGGLRGVILLEVLFVVESAIKKVLRDNRDKYVIPERGELEIDLADYFTAMAGVNSGSWIVGYLASKGGKGACTAVFNKKEIIAKYGTIRPGSLDGLSVLFFEYGKKIYGRNFDMFKLSRIFRPPWDNIPRITFPAHPQKGLETALDDFLGEVMMDDLNTIVFLPAYDLIRRAAVLFVSGNFRGAADVPSYTYIFETRDTPRDPDLKTWTPTAKVYENKKYRLRDVVQSASAAIPLHEAKRFTPMNDESFEFYCTDGSLMANNPTLQTLIFMASKYDGIMGNISILSIGTGITGGAMLDRRSAGGLQWMTSRDFFTIITQGRSELIQAQLDMLYYFVLREFSNIRRGQYLRVQTSADEERSEGIALQTVDEMGTLEQLQNIGKSTADAYRGAIDLFVDAFVFGHNLTSFEFESYLERDPTRISFEVTEEPANEAY